MCVCICIYIYGCIFIYLCICTLIHIHIYVYIFVNSKLFCLRSLDVFGALPAHRHGCRGFPRETRDFSRRRGEIKRTSLVGNCFPQETPVMETEALSTNRLVILGLRSHSVFSSLSRCVGTAIFGKRQNISLS